MELSPEEKRRIYEEEKARIDAEEKATKDKLTTEGGSTTSLEPNIAGLLCYLGVWITGIVFLIIEQKNSFVRFHALQSIIVFGTLSLATAILTPIPFAGGFFGGVIGVLFFILWIVLMVKAYQGQLYKVPAAGDLAEKIITPSAAKDKERAKVEEKDKYPEPPPPPPVADSGKQVGYKVEEYLTNTKTGRMTASSFAIAWSFVLLIFFNYFNQYIAYYQPEPVAGVTTWNRYPILTEDFNLWLPILTTILILSIVAHIILIIFDKYLLREPSLIVLNLFGMAVVLTLLSIFPFDFRAIPNTFTADTAYIITTIVLIGITIGLGIAALVKFIKLIVNVSTKNISY
jgi:uncharacterized membrane protein